MGLLTFKGGLHPYDGKELTMNQPITEYLPQGDLVFPLSQHIGAPAQAIVKKGDRVLVGQKIAEAGGFVSANIHSSVSGTVKLVGPKLTAAGAMVNSIVIENDGEYEAVTYETKPFAEMTKEDILAAVKEAGIVGLGGAGFPTHVKLAPKDPNAIDHIIINAAECEPYLTCDNRLLIEKPNEFLVGVKILMKAVDAPKAIIGIETNKIEAANQLDKIIHGDEYFHGIEVQPLQTKYPQGGEKQLIKACTGREVPSGKLPIETGCVVVNVASTYAIYEAVQKNKPLISRVVTITGKSVKNPSNFMVRIGTSSTALIEAAGGLPENTTNIINGGPMMGKSVSVNEFPVIKGTSGILLMTDNEAQPRQVGNCLRCGKCINACPMGLEPFLLCRLSKNNMFEDTEAERIMDCIECGSCQFTCPANRPLLDYCRYGKNKVGAIIRARQAK